MEYWIKSDKGDPPIKNSFLLALTISTGSKNKSNENKPK